MVAPALEKIVSMLQAGGIVSGYSTMKNLRDSEQLMDRTFANVDWVSLAREGIRDGDGDITFNVMHRLPWLWQASGYGLLTTPALSVAALSTMAAMEKIPGVLQRVALSTGDAPVGFAIAAVLYLGVSVMSWISSTGELERTEEMCKRYTAKYGGNQTAEVRMS